MIWFEPATATMIDAITRCQMPSGTFHYYLCAKLNTDATSGTRQLHCYWENSQTFLYSKILVFHNGTQAMLSGSQVPGYTTVYLPSILESHCYWKLPIFLCLFLLQCVWLPANQLQKQLINHLLKILHVKSSTRLVGSRDSWDGGWSGTGVVCIDISGSCWGMFSSVPINWRNVTRWIFREALLGYGRTQNKGISTRILSNL